MPRRAWRACSTGAWARSARTGCRDRGSHYFLTPRAGGKVDKAYPTQVGRALAQLGIRHIAAYSPEARGRGERLFGTLQNRLPRELADAGVTTIDEANRYLAETYIPAHNRRFRVAAEQDGSAFVPWTGSDLAEILRHHYVKATVQVRRYRDDSLALFHGPRCIGRYNRDGSLRDHHQLAA